MHTRISDCNFSSSSPVVLQQRRSASHLIRKYGNIVCQTGHAVLTLCTKGFFLVLLVPQDCPCLPSLRPEGVQACLFGVAFVWFGLMVLSDLHIATGPREFPWVWDKCYTSCAPQSGLGSLKGRWLLRVLQNRLILVLGFQKSTRALKSQELHVQSGALLESCPPPQVCSDICLLFFFFFLHVCFQPPWEDSVTCVQISSSGCVLVLRCVGIFFYVK